MRGEELEFGKDELGRESLDPLCASGAAGGWICGGRAVGVGLASAGEGAEMGTGTDAATETGAGG